jgi:hypothetical protein
VTHVMFIVEHREVGREALAEPGVVPIAFGHRVATDRSPSQPSRLATG